MLGEPHGCSFLGAVEAALAKRMDELRRLDVCDPEHVGAPELHVRLYWTSEIGSHERGRVGAFSVGMFAWAWCLGRKRRL